MYERSGRKSSISTRVALGVIAGLSIAVQLQSGSQNASARPGQPPQTPQRSNTEPLTLTLKPGDTFSRELGGGQHHSYQIEVPAKAFLHIVIEQIGIDVILTIRDAGGSKVCEVDRPNGSRGRETISMIAPVEGIYKLEVRSLESVSAEGRYDLRVDPMREEEPQDRTQIAAEEAVYQGEQLRFHGTAESLRKAIDSFERAAQLWHSLNDRYEEAVALYGAGLSYTPLGENQKTIDCLSAAIPLFDHDVHGEAIATAAMGWPFMYLGENDQALASFSHAFELYHSQGNVRGEGLSLYGIGWVNLLRGNDQAAFKNFSDSLTRRRAARDRRGEAVTLTGIGRVEARMGQYSKALDDFDQALAALPKPYDRYVQADILSNEGWALSRMKQDQLALDKFSEALPLRRQTGDSPGEATTLYGISSAQRHLGQLKEAEKTIEEALTIIESLRARSSNQQLRLSYFASIQTYYESYIDLLIQLDKVYPAAGYVEKALHACERARARELIDLLAEAQIDLRTGVDRSLLEQERIVSEELSAETERNRQLQSRRHTNEEEEAAARTLSELNSQLQAFEEKIRLQNPNYSALVQPEPLTAAEIQRQLLDQDTGLLEYSLGDTHSYAWVVTQTDVKVYELPPRKEIESLARHFYDSLTERNRIEPNNGEDKRALVAGSDIRATAQARNLSRVLLWPLADQLRAKRLMIVAPESLQLIPFAALPVTPASGSAPLIVDHEIVVLPSASTLAVLRRETFGRKPHSKSVAIIGDPVFGVNDERLQDQTMRRASFPGSSEPGDAKIENGKTLPRLLSSRWEAKAIQALVPDRETELFLDFEASREKVSNAELADYRFVHFATHAVIDDENPELSGIVLSMVDKQGRSENGFLRSSDIFNMRLPVDLVTLSGCRTGLGKDFKGEGLVGLTRGFMYAGAPRVVVSLWDVDDKATSELMIRFYKKMLGPERLSPAAALRMAQLDLSKDPRWHSPYFWAPFVLQGEWK